MPGERLWSTHFEAHMRAIFRRTASDRVWSPQSATHPRFSKDPKRPPDRRRRARYRRLSDVRGSARFFESGARSWVAGGGGRLESVRNARLVRGLDYYRHTAFEFVTDRLGAQGTVLAGGRYDGLIESLGAATRRPGVGWAAGVERLAMLGDAEPDEPPQYRYVIDRRLIDDCPTQLRLPHHYGAADISVAGRLSRKSKEAV